MRLLYFDITQGSPIGARIIIDRLGWMKGSALIARLKWRESFQNPFDPLNKEKTPTANERLSQRQMAPVVILYQLLKEEGWEPDDALEFLSLLTREVAVAFLHFNVPKIEKSKWASAGIKEKRKRLNEIASRFFNVISENKVTERDVFTMDVTHCHFAQYAQKLDMPEIGPLFCAADRYFFDHHQPDIRFERHQTLARDGRPCDFKFTWKDQAFD